MDHNRRRGGGSGRRIELDQFSALSVRIDALQKQLQQSRQVKAMEQLQSVSCDLYGDEGHGYLECPLTQSDEGVQQVNSINNKSPFMTNPSFKPYPKDSPEFQKWVQGRQGSVNYGNYNKNSYQNNKGNR
jgi:hypothetical protein